MRRQMVCIAPSASTWAALPPLRERLFPQLNIYGEVSRLQDRTTGGRMLADGPDAARRTKARGASVGAKTHGTLACRRSRHLRLSHRLSTSFSTSPLSPR